MQVSNSFTGFQAENYQTPSGMVVEQTHVVCKLFTHWASSTLMRFQGTPFSEAQTRFTHTNVGFFWLSKLSYF